MLPHWLITLWAALVSIPRIEPGQLLPGVVLLLAWLMLSPFQAQLVALGTDALVLSVIAFWVARTWRNMPLSLAGLNRARVGKPENLRWALWAMLSLCAVMLWFNDPLLCQRVFSVIGALLVLSLLFALWGDVDFLDHFAPKGTGGWPVVQRRHYLQVRVLVTLSLIALNEALIAQGSLSFWISVMAFQALFAHMVHWLLILLTYPSETDPTDRA